MQKLITLTSILACLISANSAAEAQHDVRVFLSESGVEVVEEQTPRYVPAILFPPTLSRSIGCMDFVQSDTLVNFSVDNLDIVLLNSTRIQVEIVFSLAVEGELSAGGCLDIQCHDSVSVVGGHATMDFDLSVVGGQPNIVANSVILDIRPDEFSFSLAECGFTGTAVTNAIEFGEGWILDFVADKVDEVAQDSLGPALETMLSGLGMEGPYVNASLDDLYFPNDGISLTVDVGFPIPLEADRCVRDFDKGPPGRELGASVPDMQGPGASDLNLAVNLGLVNDALYSAWRAGLMCLNSARIAALGVELDLSVAGTLLPGFPPGTEFSLETKFTDYPRITSEPAEGARLVVTLSGLQVDLHGDRPDGTRNTLHAEISVEATALLAVDPATNAIFAQLEDAEIKHLFIQDERKAVDAGYDIAGIKRLVHDGLLPSILEELGPIPVTGAVFSALDYAVILRSLSTNKAYLSAGVDVFRAPEDDNNPPTTQIVYPEGVSNPHTAAIGMTGSDDEVLSELLRYEIRIDGILQPTGFVREIRVGEYGQTASYRVEVAAMDLAGNVDPTPSVVTLLVDGIAPVVKLSGSRTVDADEGATSLNWTLADDLSASQDLGVRVEVYKLVDPADALSAVKIDSYELSPGATTFELDLSGKGGLYRVEVHAEDEAGNEGVSSMLMTSASSGGCSVGTSQSPGATAILLFLGLVGLGMRRRRE